MPNGLVQQAEQAPAAAGPVPAGPGLATAAGPAPEEAAMGEEEESNLTPEEQEAYDSAMKMVGELVYNNDESHDAIMEQIDAENPAESAADTTIFLMEKVEETFQGEYPEDLVLITADEISDLVLELLEESGGAKVTDKIAMDTKNIVVEMLGDEYGAEPDDVAEALQDVTPEDAAQMQQMVGAQNG